MTIPMNAEIFEIVVSMDRQPDRLWVHRMMKCINLEEEGDLVEGTEDGDVTEDVGEVVEGEA